MAAVVPESLGPPPDRNSKILDRSPGPAKYVFPSSFEDKKKSHMYSFTGKPRAKRDYPTPDPSKYSQIDMKPAGYSFSMAGKFRVRDKEDIPGPGAYYDDKKAGKLPSSFGGGPAYSLSGRHRFISKSSQLGPGSHNLDTGYQLIKSNPPAFSLAQKFRFRDKSTEPGPGQYLGHDKEFGKQGKKVSLSGRHRLKREHETPGPAHYPSQNWLAENRSPKFSFGNSKRAIERHWSTTL